MPLGEQTEIDSQLRGFAPITVDVTSLNSLLSRLVEQVASVFILFKNIQRD